MLAETGHALVPRRALAISIARHYASI